MDLSDAMKLEVPDVSIVSGRGTRYEVPEAAREWVALLSDWTLLVVEAKRADQAVRAYEQMLLTQGVKYEIRTVNLEQFANLTGKASAKADKASQSAMQVRVIGLVKDARKLRASDIHFLNYPNSTIVKMRIHGLLIEKPELELSPKEGEALCRCMYESMTDVAEPNYNSRQTQDGRLSRRFLTAAGLNGARIATRPMEYGNLVVLRLLYESGSSQKTLPLLGYNARQVADIRQMLRRKGVNIFSGETGSGKSTSLQVVLSMLLDLHHRLINLVTVEQPTEYVIEGAVQTPLLLAGADDMDEIGEAWAKAISNLMRLDPDFIMVGELRDLASSVMAIRAALTGHGLWTTTHASDGFATWDRLEDLGVPLRRLTNARLFTGAVNQSLAPVLCPTCKVSFKKHRDSVEADLRSRIERFCVQQGVFLRGSNANCPTCAGLGVVDRTVAAEVVLTTQKLLDVYREGGAGAAREYWVREMGGITKCQHLIQKINEGLVDPGLGEDAVCGLDEDEFLVG